MTKTISHRPHMPWISSKIRMIALALMGNPKLLIADEPTTALDMSVQADVLDLIDELRRKNNLTVILVTHDLLHASRSEWIVHLGHDGVMEQGSHRELMALGGPYARLYGLQATAHEDDTTPSEDPTYAIG